MSLNCLACQALKRNNSDREYDKGKSERKPCLMQGGRNWSGTINPPPCEQTGRGSIKKMIKKEPRGLNGTGMVAFKGTEEPRLVRCSGMRRDWSFENLSQWRTC